jgi:hypothetical protein
MNQKGDTTMFSIFILMTLSSLMILGTLELQRNLELLKKRTKLFLCTKIAKGELDKHLRFLSRTNWALKNISRAKLLALFLPGFQVASLSSARLKQLIKTYQNLELLRYLNKLREMGLTGCFVDPKMLKTPFEINSSGYNRNVDETTKQREEKWEYRFIHPPYQLNLKIYLPQSKSLKPQIDYSTEERQAMSHITSVYAY